MALLGSDYGGIVTSDRHSAYNWLADERRQLCWSHLQRDFQALVDRGRVGGDRAPAAGPIQADVHALASGT
ncbi:MAG: transposase [Ardenticatenaceae bacterium]|nr:transposase [Ardenticatenaceae bacterium]